MRRSLASLLLAVLMAPFALPWAQAQPDAHACCRRSGQHHCAAPAGADGFRATATCCPFQRSIPLLSHSETALRASASSLPFTLSWHRSVSFSSPDIARQLAGNAQKRGPPLA
jgi:hypothetical protein